MTEYQQELMNAVEFVGGLVSFLVGYLTVVNS